MLEEPTCYTRECKHFMGIAGYKEPDQYFICKAFPDGIPDKITYGDNLHLEPLKDQGNDIVYTHNQGEEEVNGDISDSEIQNIWIAT